MSSIKSKYNPAYVIQDTDLFPLLDDPDGAGTGVAISGMQLKALMGIDASSVLHASVQLRSDVLQNLLAVTDAGDGELAIATDNDVIVQYKGEPSVAKMYGAGAPIYQVHLQPAEIAVSIPDNAWTAPHFLVMEDSKGIFDEVDQEFVLPKINGLLPRWLKIYVRFNGTGSGGTYRGVALEREIVTSIWGQTITSYVEAPTVTDEPMIGGVLFENSYRYSPVSHDGKKHRLALKQDSGGALPVFASYVTMEFGF